MQNLLEAINSWALKTAYHETLKDVALHIPSVQRVERGYDILVRDSIYAIRRGSEKVLTFYIYNSEREVDYEVIPSRQSCTCEDAKQNICKHRFAIKIYLTAWKLQKEAKRKECV